MGSTPNPAKPSDGKSQPIKADALPSSNEGEDHNDQNASEDSEKSNSQTETESDNHRPDSSSSSPLFPPQLTPFDLPSSSPPQDPAKQKRNSTVLEMLLGRQNQEGDENSGDCDDTELAKALEPFGYGRDKTNGKRCTTLKNLPSIMAKFQESRTTVYFSPEQFEQLKEYAAISPETVLYSNELIPLLEQIRASNSSSSDPDIQVQRPPSSPRPVNIHRVRSADSPPSSDGENAAFYGTHSPTHTPSPTPSSGVQTFNESPPSPSRRVTQSGANYDGDDSFDSLGDNTFRASTDAERTDTEARRPKSSKRHSKSSSSPVYSLGDRPRPVPKIDIRHDRPLPPNRRKRASIDSRTNTAQNTPDINRVGSSGLPTIESDQNPEGLGEEASVVAFRNRQGGFFSPRSEFDTFEQSQQRSRDESELMRRLRLSEPETLNPVYSDIDHPTSWDEPLDENYSQLAQKYESLKQHYSMLNDRLHDLGKAHEDELVKLNDNIVQLTQDYELSKKREVEFEVKSKRQAYQLGKSDEQMEKMDEELKLLKNNYAKLKQNCDEALTELERARQQLNAREEELRRVNRSVQSHEGELKKWETERSIFEDRIKEYKAEIADLNKTRAILEEQKHINLDLQMTIDKLKQDLEEQRSRYSGSIGPSSRPISIAGSIRNTFGAELKRAMASGEYEAEDGNLSDATEADEVSRIVRGLGDDSSVNEKDEVYEEIQIKRIKRRKAKNPDSTVIEGDSSTSIEEVIEVQDASTDCDGLISLNSVHTQTDPIPEPPPVYRPKTEEIEIQTEDPEQLQLNISAARRKDIEELIKGVDLGVLKLAIQNITQENANARQLGNLSDVHYIPQSGSGDEDDEDEDSDLKRPQSPKMGYFRRNGSSLTNTIINVFPPMNFNNQPPFGRSEFSLMNLSFKMCSSVLFLLSTGYFLGNLIFNSPSSPAYIVHLLRTAGSDASFLNAFINMNSIAIGGEGLVIGYVGRTPSLFTRLADQGFKTVWEIIAANRRHAT